MKFYGLTILFFFFSSVGFSQTSNKAENFRLIETRLSAFITFENFVTREPRFIGENKNKILLRFHNNTMWNLTIATLACRTVEDECMLFYTIDKIPDPTISTVKCEYPQINRREHVSSAKTIKSGKSLLFTVPKEHLADELFIEVGFSYEWEAGGDSGGSGYIIHKIPFFSSDLPKEKNK